MTVDHKYKSWRNIEYVIYDCFLIDLFRTEHLIENFPPALDENNILIY